MSSEDHVNAPKYNSTDNNLDGNNEQDETPESASSLQPDIRNHNHDGVIKCDSHIPVTYSTIIFSLCAALNSCNLGFDIGVSTVVGPLLQDGEFALSNFQTEIFMGSINFFAMIGAIFASDISDRFGRRCSFVVAALTFIFGIIIMVSAPNYTALIFGRVFVGIGVGFGLAIDPLYISEIAPASHRGRLVTWSEIAVNIGIVLGFSSGLFFFNIENDVAWRVMFALGLVMPICLVFLTTFVMPESPRWLVSKGSSDKAREILIKIYPEGLLP